MDSLETSYIKCLVFCALCLIILPNCTNSKASSDENPGWTFKSLRAEIDPAHWTSEKVQFQGTPTLVLSGDNKEYVNGSWAKTFPVTTNNFYQFTTHFKADNVDEIDRSVLVQLTWLDEKDNRVEYHEFPGLQAQQAHGEWMIIQQTYQVPEGAIKAMVELVYRWDASGTVYFGGTSLEDADPIKPRKVRLAAITTGLNGRLPLRKVWNNSANISKMLVFRMQILFVCLKELHWWEQVNLTWKSASRCPVRPLLFWDSWHKSTICTLWREF